MRVFNPASQTKQNEYDIKVGSRASTFMPVVIALIHCCDLSGGESTTFTSDGSDDRWVRRKETE